MAAKRLGDGFDLSGIVSLGVDTIRFVYRPMLRHERRLVMHNATFLGGGSGSSYLLKECVDRVQAWSIGPDVCLDQMTHLESSNPKLWSEMWMVISGLRMGNWEHETADNLKRGLTALITAPGFARKTCGDCRKHWLDRRGNYILEGGLKLLRPDGSVLPCESEIGCAVGHYSKPVRLSRINCMAYDNHVRCAAIGQWPDDAIVKRNAAIINRVLSEHYNRRHIEIGAVALGHRHVATTDAGQRANAGRRDGSISSGPITARER